MTEDMAAAPAGERAGRSVEAGVETDRPRIDAKAERARLMAQRRAEGGLSRVTALLRLAVAAWLIWSAVAAVAEPSRVSDERGLPVAMLLPYSGLSFALGIFLLTGFMSRIGGLLLVAMGVWQWQTVGFSVEDVALMAAGVYLALRGGGAYAMDVYVQMMQDRVRLKEALKAEERSEQA